MSDMKYELAYTMAITTAAEEKLATGMFPQDYECGDVGLHAVDRAAVLRPKNWGELMSQRA